MKLNVAVQMDPIARINIRGDSTFALLLEAQKRGLLKYVRGSVEIVDREGLERGACECRASVQHLRRELEPESVLGRPPEPGLAKSR